MAWDFLGLVERGRFKDHAEDGQADTIQFWREVGTCEFEVLPGPGKLMRWGVADAAVHDDMLISAALVAVCDGLPWSVQVPDQVVEAGDHLARLDRARRGW